MVYEAVVGQSNGKYQAADLYICWKQFSTVVTAFSMTKQPIASLT